MFKAKLDAIALARNHQAGVVQFEADSLAYLQRLRTALYIYKRVVARLSQNSDSIITGSAVFYRHILPTKGQDSSTTHTGVDIGLRTQKAIQPDFTHRHSGLAVQLNDFSMQLVHV